MRNGRPWTAADLETLHWMRANGDENPKIAEALGRSEGSVEAKLRGEIRSGAVALRHARIWLDSERAQFRLMRSNGDETPKIAHALGRSVRSVERLTMEEIQAGFVERRVPASPWNAASRRELRRLHRLGLGPTKIAANTGYSLNAIRHELRRQFRSGTLARRPVTAAEAAKCRSVGRAAAFCARANIPVSTIEDYRLYRFHKYTAAEAAAFCRGEARP